ncbi:MAG: terpene cyclase/mutase family protein [Planctomycetes bacterium]|nr:terpene cyclase/mutase family protein [Planctomycetota bacterium]
MTEPYLLTLAARLAAGLSRMDADRRRRHRDFILTCRQSDGGFRGREGESDLYYTSFALRGLAMLGGRLDEDPARQAAEYLRGFELVRLSIVDTVSWLNAAAIVQLSGGDDPLSTQPADWPEHVAARLESVRTADGGYAKAAEGAAGSTYHSFLVTLSYQLLGRAVPRPNALIQFLYDRQRDDGGFVEIAPMKRSGTNPTAAAVALLHILGGMDDEIRDDVQRFLLEVRSGEGGFQANTRIPFADGLSTFTGLLTVQHLALPDVIDEAAVERFVSGELEFPTGGFRGAAWDDQADVEYTFYGLANLALCARP